MVQVTVTGNRVRGLPRVFYALAGACLVLGLVLGGSIAVLNGMLARSTGSTSKIGVVFRYDDYSSRSPTDLETELIDTFAALGVECVFAVVPFVGEGDLHEPDGGRTIPLTSEKIALLRSGMQKGAVHVALHGYSHRTNSRRWYREFEGLDAVAQRDRIREGKEFLQGTLGIKVTTFIPPWNRYDVATLMALDEARFACISAGLSGPARELGRLKYLPATCELKNVGQALDKARSIADPQPVVVCVFHPFDFRDSGDQRAWISFEEFRHLLQWLAEQPDVEILSFAEILEKPAADLSPERLLANRRARYARFLLPWFLGHCRHVYISSRTTARMMPWAWVIGLSFYSLCPLAASALSFGLGTTVLSKARLLVSLARWVTLAMVTLGMLLAFLASVMRHYRLARLGLLGCSVLVGLYCGWLLGSRFYPPA